MSRNIHRQRIPSSDHRLRRHVNHDPKSWAYAFPTEGLTIRSVRHTRHIPILDQAHVGSCCGNAGIGCLATDPDWPMVEHARYTPDEAGAVNLYSDAQTISGVGPYPPHDEGSDGLSVAKALKSAGMIAGYQHTFGLDDALKALSVTAFITGIGWYEKMSQPDAEGIVKVGGRLAGGHEIVVDEYDTTRGLVGLTNSWSAAWGVGGRFYLAAEDYGTLLDDQGDVTILLPPNPPAPSADPDRVLARAVQLDGWVTARHVGPNRRAAEAAQRWLTAKGL